jgi:NAD(P) transhydrogenase subunit alpha
MLYSRNVLSLLELGFDFEDEVIKGACVVRDGEIVHEGARAAAEVTS